MALSKTQLKTEKQFEHRFKQAYKKQFFNYLQARNEVLLVTDIKERYSKQWTEDEIYQFLTECFDQHGNILQNLITDNPVYNHITREGGELNRLRYFFDEPEDLFPRNKPTKNQLLNQKLNFKEIFILDAINQHLVGDLIQEFTNYISTILPRGYKGTESIEVSRKINSWAQDAAGEYLEAFLAKKKLKIEKSSLFKPLLDNFAFKLELHINDLQAIGRIRETGRISRSFNQAELMNIPQRNRLLENFYKNNVTRNNTITNPLLAGDEIENERSFVIELKAFNDSKQCFLVNGKINPRLAKILKTYQINQNDFLFILREEFKLSHRLVFDSYGEPRPYLQEIYNQLKALTDQAGNPLFKDEEIKGQLLGATTQPLGSWYVHKLENEKSSEADRGFTGAFLIFFGQQFNIIKDDPAMQSELNRFLNPPLKVKEPGAVSIARIILEGTLTLGLGTVGFLLGGLGGTFVFPGVGTVAGALAGASSFASIALLTIGSMRNTSQSKKRQASGVLISSGLAGVVGGSLGAFVGSVLVPIPILGSVVGGIVGSILGAVASSIPMLTFRFFRLAINDVLFKKKPRETAYKNPFQHPKLQPKPGYVPIAEQDDKPVQKNVEVVKQSFSAPLNSGAEIEEVEEVEEVEEDNHSFPRLST